MKIDGVPTTLGDRVVIPPDNYESARENGIYEVECPVCNARRGEACMDATGPLGYVPYTGRYRVHPGRYGR